MRQRLLPLFPALVLLPALAHSEGMRDDARAPSEAEQVVGLLDSGLDPAVALRWQQPTGIWAAMPSS